MGADSIMFRAVRASGIVCQLASANAVTIDTAASRYYSATRLPVSGGRDQLMLFLELDSTTAADDRWVSGRPITSVGPGTCATAYGSRPGLQLGTSLGYTGHADSLTIGSPFRTYEVMVYRALPERIQLLPRRPVGERRRSGVSADARPAHRPAGSGSTTTTLPARSPPSARPTSEASR